MPNLPRSVAQSPRVGLPFAQGLPLATPSPRREANLAGGLAVPSVAAAAVAVLNQRLAASEIEPVSDKADNVMNASGSQPEPATCDVERMGKNASPTALL